MSVVSLAAATAVKAASTAILYAASYSGGITSLQLTNTNSGYTLKNISIATECGANPVWLEHDKNNSILYCSDEAGTLGIFRVPALNSSTAGVLEALNEMGTSYAPVASTRFNISDQPAIAFANYGSPDGGPPGPAGITVYTIKDNGVLQRRFNMTAWEPVSGPNEERQSAAHFHQVVLDPTRNFVVTPDLGADSLHVFSLHDASFLLTQLDDVNLEPGSGPRHGVFQTVGTNTFFHVVSELANNITSFNVTYDGKNGMSMAQIGQVSTFGDKAAPSGALAGEIIISEGGYITVSNRLDNSFTIPNLDPNIADPEQSDSLAVFKVDDQGKLSYVNLYPVGCQSPRQIQTNRDGSLITAACMANDRVVVMQRNSTTGEIGQPVAHYTLPGATYIGWDEL